MLCREIFLEKKGTWVGMSSSYRKIQNAYLALAVTIILIQASQDTGKQKIQVSIILFIVFCRLTGHTVIHVTGICKQS